MFFQPSFFARMHVHHVHWPYAYATQRLFGPCCPLNQASASFSLMPTTFVESVLPDTACADDWPPWGSFTFMEPLYR